MERAKNWQDTGQDEFNDAYVYFGWCRPWMHQGISMLLIRVITVLEWWRRAVWSLVWLVMEWLCSWGNQLWNLCDSEHLSWWNLCSVRWCIWGYLKSFCELYVGRGLLEAECESFVPVVTNNYYQHDDGDNVGCDSQVTYVIRSYTCDTPLSTPSPTPAKGPTLPPSPTPATTLPPLSTIMTTQVLSVTQTISGIVNNQLGCEQLGKYTIYLSFEQPDKHLRLQCYRRPTISLHRSLPHTPPAGVCGGDQ